MSEAATDAFTTAFLEEFKKYVSSLKTLKYSYALTMVLEYYIISLEKSTILSYECSSEMCTCNTSSVVQRLRDIIELTIPESECTFVFTDELDQCMKNIIKEYMLSKLCTQCRLATVRVRAERSQKEAQALRG